MHIPAIRQSAAALAIGILFFMAGEFAGAYATVMETAGVLLAVAGGIGILLGLVVTEREHRP
ncbi:MAG TPA: hypothetical protein PLU94_04775 [Methanoregulaceae archaeon]|nr:hypothetical protein [Methanoregulaceae archaeon]HPM62861.1 hypothetical protein [Methanoregulaceae archaeon]